MCETLRQHPEPPDPQTDQEWMTWLRWYATYGRWHEDCYRCKRTRDPERFIWHKLDRLDEFWRRDEPI